MTKGAASDRQSSPHWLENIQRGDDPPVDFYNSNPVETNALLRLHLAAHLGGLHEDRLGKRARLDRGATSDRRKNDGGRNDRGRRSDSRRTSGRRRTSDTHGRNGRLHTLQPLQTLQLLLVSDPVLGHALKHRGTAEGTTDRSRRGHWMAGQEAGRTRDRCQGRGRSRQRMAGQGASRTRDRGGSRGRWGSRMAGQQPRRARDGG